MGPRLGHIGAFAIDNTGDILVGLASRQALRAICPALEITTFAPALSHDFWRLDFGLERGIDAPITPVPLGSGLDWTADFDALVIGGGGLISSEPTFSIFLLHGTPERAPPAAWNALGSLHEPWYHPELAGSYRTIRACADQIAYVSVRNRTTLKYLRRCGVTADIEVVPDPAFLLALDHPRSRAEVRRSLGLDPDRFLVGLSVGSSIRDPRARPFFTGLFKALADINNDETTDLVMFPFGNVYADMTWQGLAHEGLRVARLLEPRMPLDVWQLIGALDLYIGTRFHAIIAAYAQDVPFLIIDEYLSDKVASSKLRELAVDESLEPYYLSPWLTVEPELKLFPAFEEARAGQRSAGARIAEHRARLRLHYRAMLEALGIEVDQE